MFITVDEEVRDKDYMDIISLMCLLQKDDIQGEDEDNELCSTFYQEFQIP